MSIKRRLLLASSAARICLVHLGALLGQCQIGVCSTCADYVVLYLANMLGGNRAVL